MASPESLFETRVRWTGSYAPGPLSARSYTRDMLVDPGGKPPILGSASSRYLGDDGRYNPGHGNRREWVHAHQHRQRKQQIGAESEGKGSERADPRAHS